MANVFDQFDAPAAPTAPAVPASGNVFDQFDAPAAATPSQSPDAVAAAVAADPSAPPPSDDVSTWQHVKNAAGRVGQRLEDDAGYANGLVRSAANSVPILGAYADKLDAATDSALTGKSPAQAAADQQATDQSFKSQNPVASGAAGFAGAAGGSAAMLPEVGMGLVGTLGQRMAGGAVGGATLGAADNVARGNDATSGAIEGGIGGAAGPVVGQALGAGYRGLMGLVQPTPAELQGTGRIATNWLRQGVAGMTPEDYAAAKDAVGPAGMFAEINPQMLDLSKSVADQAGAGKPIVRNAFQDRMDTRNDRVNDLVNGSLGPAQSPLQFKGALDEQAAPYAQAQAEAIRNAGPVDVAGTYQNLTGALPNAAPGSPEYKAYKQAVTMLSDRPQPGPSGFDADPVGSSTPPDMPNYPDPVPLDDTSAPSKPGPVGVARPQDLHGFIKSAGGMQDPGGDLSSMGLGNLIAKPGQGLGPDAMRQAAAQSGYLGADVDHAMANTSVNDLLDAVGSDSPIHSVYDQDAVQAWNQRDAAMQAYQQGGAGNPSSATGVRQPAAPGLPFGGPDVDPSAVPVTPPPAVPTTNAARILSARKAIDDKIDYSGPTTEAPSSALRSQQGVYQQARRGLSDALHQQVPGYSEPTDALAVINRQRDAMNDGVDALGAGKQAIRPDDFATQFAALSPEEQAAYRVGMRSTVDQALGTRPNDFQALKGVTQGENGWNSSKLGTAFGQDASNAVNKGIDQETQMARNSQHVIGGSPTNENEQIRRLTSPEGMSSAMSGLADYADNFAWGKPVSWVPPYFQPRNAYNRMMEGAAEQARAQMAPHLVKSGPEADALFQALLAQSQRRGALPAPNTDPLVTALMGASQYARQGMSGQ